LVHFMANPRSHVSRDAEKHCRGCASTGARSRTRSGKEEVKGKREDWVSAKEMAARGRQAAITKWPRYGEDEKKALAELLDNGRWYDEIPLLEDELKQYLKAPYVKSHCNGTSALTSMFFALNLPRGSEIMAPSYTAWATTAPMQFFGYVPLFVDINPRTMTFDLEYAKKRLNPRVRAILPMHSFGNPCDMDEICEFGKQHGLAVVEDAAQAHGATLKGKQMGTWGAIGAFSFQATKILPSIEGGCGAYQSREHYERATMFGNYELPRSFPADSPYRKYGGTGMGLKFRIHPLGAAIARKQLRGMDQRNALIDAQVRKLTDRLAGLPGLSVPYCRPDAKRVYWTGHLLFLDEAKAGCSREAVVKALQAEGVRAGVATYDEQHKYVLYSDSSYMPHTTTKAARWFSPCRLSEAAGRRPPNHPPLGRPRVRCQHHTAQAGPHPHLGQGRRRRSLLSVQPPYRHRRCPSPAS